MKAGASLAKPREDNRTAGRKPLPSVPPIPGFTPRSEDAFAHLLRRVAPERLVLSASAISVVIYLAFVVAFPIWSLWNQPHAPNDPNVINDLGRITGYSPFAAAGFVIAILALFVAQFLMLLAVGRVPQTASSTNPRDRLVRRAVFVFPLLFAALLIWMQPVTTTDLYGYVARGYLYAHLHLNPMITAATQLPGGLSVNRPAAPYGPFWLLVAGLLSRVSGENLLVNMLLFKLIGFAGVAAALWLVDSLALRLYPERRLRIIVLFAWSPLLLFESVGNGHNDIVMVVCVLAAFSLMLRGHARSAFALFVVGALIKYFSAIFVAFWLVYELRRRVRRPVEARAAAFATVSLSPTTARDVVAHWARTAVRTVSEIDHKAAAWLLAQATLIGAALVAIGYAPFWVGFSTFTGLGQQLRPLYYNASIVGFVTAPLQLIVTPSQYLPLDKTVRLVVYAFFALYTYIHVQRLWMLGPAATLRDVITACAKVTFAALLLITFWFQPWYVVWLLPLAALSNEAYVRRAAAIFACGALLTYAVGNYLFATEAGLAQALFVQFFEILVAFAPLLFLRAAPYDQGWRSILRRYAGLFSDALDRWPDFWQRLMLALIVVVACILRLVRLGNLFATVGSGGSETGILKAASGDLRLGLTDPQGLQKPFDALQSLLLAVFGRTPFAVLLPSAIIGSLTVLMIYVVTYEIVRQGDGRGRRTIPLLAALLAATSAWHVSLSRSGTEVVLLSLLLLLAMYWLLRALRMRTAVPVSAAHNGKALSRSARKRKRREALQARQEAMGNAPTRRPRHQLLLLIGCGVCTGLGCDVAPGLWLVPLVVIGVCLLWRSRGPAHGGLTRKGLLVLVTSTVVASIPVIWYFVSQAIGFPEGSILFARTTSHLRPLPGLLTGAFWGQVAHNAGDVMSLLTSQDYSAGYPSVGGAPIVPTLLGPFYYIGLAFILWRWRSFTSQAVLLLLALPLVASIAVGTPTGVIEAASVLPAMCVIPAVGLFEVASWLGHLPIVLDRANGVRIFSTPEQMGRVLLLIFLVVSTVRTFFWYFEVTLPTAPLDQYVPSYVGPHIASLEPGRDNVPYVLVSVART